MEEDVVAVADLEERKGNGESPSTTLEEEVSLITFNDLGPGEDKKGEAIDQVPVVSTAPLVTDWVVWPQFVIDEVDPSFWSNQFWSIKFVDITGDPEAMKHGEENKKEETAQVHMATPSIIEGDNSPTPVMNMNGGVNHNDPLYWTIPLMDITDYPEPVEPHDEKREYPDQASVPSISIIHDSGQTEVQEEDETKESPDQVAVSSIFITNQSGPIEPQVDPDQVSDLTIPINDESEPIEVQEDPDQVPVLPTPITEESRPIDPQENPDQVSASSIPITIDESGPIKLQEEDEKNETPDQISDLSSPINNGSGRIELEEEDESQGNPDQVPVLTTPIIDDSGLVELQEEAEKNENFEQIPVGPIPITDESQPIEPQDEDEKKENPDHVPVPSSATIDQPGPIELEKDDEKKDNPYQSPVLSIHIVEESGPIELQEGDEKKDNSVQVPVPSTSISEESGPVEPQENHDEILALSSPIVEESGPIELQDEDEKNETPDQVAVLFTPIIEESGRIKLQEDEGKENPDQVPVPSIPTTDESGPIEPQEVSGQVAVMPTPITEKSGTIVTQDVPDQVPVQPISIMEECGQIELEEEDEKKENPEQVLVPSIPITDESGPIELQEEDEKKEDPEQAHVPSMSSITDESGPLELLEEDEKTENHYQVPVLSISVVEESGPNELVEADEKRENPDEALVLSSPIIKESEPIGTQENPVEDETKGNPDQTSVLSSPIIEDSGPIEFQEEDEKTQNSDQVLVLSIPMTDESRPIDPQENPDQVPVLPNSIIEEFRPTEPQEVPDQVAVPSIPIMEESGQIQTQEVPYQVPVLPISIMEESGPTEPQEVPGHVPDLSIPNENEAGPINPQEEDEKVIVTSILITDESRPIIEPQQNPDEVPYLSTPTTDESGPTEPQEEGEKKFIPDQVTVPSIPIIEEERYPTFIAPNAQCDDSHLRSISFADIPDMPLLTMGEEDNSKEMTDLQEIHSPTTSDLDDAESSCSSGPDLSDDTMSQIISGSGDYNNPYPSEKDTDKPIVVVHGRTSLAHLLDHDMDSTEMISVKPETSQKASNGYFQATPSDDNDDSSPSESTSSEEEIIDNRNPITFRYPRSWNERAIENRQIILDERPSSSRSLHLDADIEDMDDEYEEDDEEFVISNEPDPDLGKGALDLVIHSYPTTADFKFYLSCVSCETECGPPEVSCQYGHMICITCYQRPRALMTICPAKVLGADAVTPDVCGGQVKPIAQGVKNTPYFKYFMENATYACGARSLGCNALLSGYDVLEHEMFECPYNFIRYCGFRRAGCNASFQDVNHHLYHLIVAHKIPIEHFSEGPFLIQYDRDEHINDDINADPIKPLIRAILESRKKKVTCFLMMEEVENPTNKKRFTRIYLANIYQEKKLKITASLAICRPSTGMNVLEKIIYESEVKVLPTLSHVVGMGPDHYLDIDHSRLDKAMFLLRDKKFLHILVKLSIVKDCEDNGDNGPQWELESEPESPQNEDQSEEEEEDDTQGEEPKSNESSEGDPDDDYRAAMEELNELERRAAELEAEAKALRNEDWNVCSMTEEVDEDKLEAETERREKRKELMIQALALKRQAHGKRSELREMRGTDLKKSPGKYVKAPEEDKKKDLGKGPRTSKRSSKEDMSICRME